MFVNHRSAFNIRDDPDGSRTAEKLRTKDPMCSFMYFVVPVIDPFIPTMGNGLDRSFTGDPIVYCLILFTNAKTALTERCLVPVGNDLFIN
ncbi:hypothetical protein RF55_3319 [Lasius niger]|uniref:Uncharacterized protein n=1 Tax=Lasius niger TaxID=67767 RepID=A0A0J7L1C4_LASNI|nr:hypothetical protein RF55_3319 [Lasius niger]